MFEGVRGGGGKGFTTGLCLIDVRVCYTRGVRIFFSARFNVQHIHYAAHKQGPNMVQFYVHVPCAWRYIASSTGDYVTQLIK